MDFVDLIVAIVTGIASLFEKKKPAAAPARPRQAMVAQPASAPAPKVAPPPQAPMPVPPRPVARPAAASAATAVTLVDERSTLMALLASPQSLGAAMIVAEVLGRPVSERSR